MNKQDFIKAGFTVVGTDTNENKLLRFLKENYPNVIRDTEINLEELKSVLGLPIDEKVNGYGLNFVGRNFARAKYAQKTEKELRLNKTLSKNIDTSTSLSAGTQNLVLKGDNLDSLKILKNHYSSKIKCIYIDPPYNTTSDEFVYPDKFDKEETEVLGLANLSESDFTRMDFSFKTKKSHNGWLAFMYPRLLLARDLLSKEGVIFISIDDNEQANLKLLCDDVFGEENFVGNICVKSRASISNDKIISSNHNFILLYAKNQQIIFNERHLFGVEKNLDNFKLKDEKGEYKLVPVDGPGGARKGNPYYTFLGITGYWRFSEKTMQEKFDSGLIVKTENNLQQKYYKSDAENSKQTVTSWWDEKFFTSEATKKINEMLGESVFETPKPIELIKRTIKLSTDNNDIILDFFAGSGTTGHAVMQLNAEDGGNRKFILCQIDEPIKKDKPAYNFCIENNLPPVISSITIERLKRAGEKLSESRLSGLKDKQDLFNQDNPENSVIPDFGFKVFDCVEAPKLKVDDKGQISFTENQTDALSRIYNMIFTVGLDEPTQVPEEVVKDCIYKIGSHYYITNSEKITSDDFANAINASASSAGKIFVDGWTASLNATLQHYKENVKIVF